MKKTELIQLIREELERHVTDRMEGLTSIPALNSFKSGAITILNGLYEEGFELDEISEYLHSILDMQLNPRNVNYGLDEASNEEVENQKELNKELEKTSSLKKQMSSLSEVEDEDTIIDKEPTAKDLKNDSVATLASKLVKIKTEMKSTVDKWKKSNGVEKAKLTNRLKELTTQKREIEKLL